MWQLCVDMYMFYSSSNWCNSEQETVNWADMNIPPFWDVYILTWNSVITLEILHEACCLKFNAFVFQRLASLGGRSHKDFFKNIHVKHIERYHWFGNRTCLVIYFPDVLGMTYSSVFRWDNQAEEITLQKVHYAKPIVAVSGSPCGLFK